MQQRRRSWPGYNAIRTWRGVDFAARDSATVVVIVCGDDRKYLGIVLAHVLRTALL